MNTKTAEEIKPTIQQFAISQAIEYFNHFTPRWGEAEYVIYNTLKAANDAQLATPSLSPKNPMQEFMEEMKVSLSECLPEFKIGIQHAILRASSYLDENPTPVAVPVEDWISLAKEAFEKIIKECEGSGLKNCAIGNKQHMAIYHSKHLANIALTTLNKTA